MPALWLMLTLASVGLGYQLAGRQPWAAPTQPGRGSAARLGMASLVLLLTVLGAGLRFHGLNFGLPDHYHPDETVKVNVIMRMAAADSLNPDYFLHPSLLLYSTYGLATLLQFLRLQDQSPASLLLAGRAVSALAGTLSIPVLFLLGRRLGGRLTGLTAAALLAVFPLHITCSRVLKEDALLTFFMLLASWAVVRAAQQGRKALLFVAAACIGLATSTKYSGALALLILVTAPWLRSRSWYPDRQFLWAALAALPFVALFFVLASPFTLLNPQVFLADLRCEWQHLNIGHGVPIDPRSYLWMYHISPSVVPVSALFTTLAALIGIGLLARRRRIEDLFLIGLLLAFFLPAEWAPSKPAPQPERYILPCLPLFAVAAASAVQAAFRLLPRRVAICVLIGVVVPPLWRSLALARDIGTDTRLQAVRWLQRHAAAGAKVLIEYRPYFPSLAATEFEPIDRTSSGPTDLLDPTQILASGGDYLLLSSLSYDRFFSQRWQSSSRRDRYQSLFTRLPIVAEFNAASGTYGFHNPRITIFALDPRLIRRLALQIQARQQGRLALTDNELRSQFFRDHGASLSGVPPQP